MKPSTIIFGLLTFILIVGSSCSYSSDPWNCVRVNKPDEKIDLPIDPSAQITLDGISEDVDGIDLDTITFDGLVYIRARPNSNFFVSKTGDRSLREHILYIHEWGYPPYTVVTTDPLTVHGNLLKSVSTRLYKCAP